MTDADPSQVHAVLARLEDAIEDVALVDEVRALLLSHADRLHVRDNRLRALRQHERYAALSDHAAARAMAADAERYEATRWPRERGTTPAPPTEPFRSFFLVLASGVPLPGERQLRRILHGGKRAGAMGEVFA
jgi:hypothetical protein